MNDNKHVNAILHFCAKQAASWHDKFNMGVHELAGLSRTIRTGLALLVDSLAFTLRVALCTHVKSESIWSEPIEIAALNAQCPVNHAG